MLICFWARGRAELALFAAITAITTVVYLFALVGLLQPAAVVIFWAGVLLCLGMPAFIHRRSPELIGQLLAPGISLFVLYTVVQWSLFHGAEYFFWDEFSHWGLATKEIVYNDRLWGADGNVRFVHYPPASSIWHYFVAQNTGYSEASVLHAQFLLLLAPTMSLYRRVTWKRPYWIPVVLALQIILFVNLGQGTSSLYMDYILAVLFGGIAVAYLADETSPRDLVLFVPPLFCLALVKEMGVFLAAAAALWIGVDRLLLAGTIRLPRERPALVQAIVVAVLLATPLVAFTTWKGYVSRHDLTTDVDVAGARAGQIVDAMRGEGEPYHDTVRLRFREVLSTQQVSRSEFSQQLNEFTFSVRGHYPQGFRMSALGFVLASLVLLAVRTALAERRRRTLVWTSVFLALLFAAYAYLMLLLYLAVFPQQKAVQLSSYVRYINTVVLPVVMVGLACYLPLGSRFGWRYGRRFAGAGIVVSCLAWLYLVETPYLAQLHVARPVQPVRGRVAELMAPVTNAVPDDARVYVISLVRDNGFMEVLLRYELSPIRTTFGTPKAMSDFQGQDYVWVFALDEADISRLGGPFASGHRLFEVTDSEGRLDLRPVM
jgi:hypothetical protein